MASQRFPGPQVSHEIVDEDGRRVGHYANKSAAGRALARSRRDWDAGWRPGWGHGSPHTFTIRPVVRS